MKLVWSDPFAKALDRLAAKDKSEADQVRRSLTEFLQNPKQPGFSLERLNKCKDPDFWSIRASDNNRVIMHRTGDTFTLCYVDRHDPAYQWAERRRFEVHSHTGAMQIVELRETVKEVTRIVERHVQAPLFAQFDSDYLHALGVPTEWLDAVKHVSEDSLPELIGHLPDEAVERLLELAAGKPVPRPAKATSVSADAAYMHPDAQRRFRVVDNQEELRQALEFPWERWIVFLHPGQRSVVEKTFSGPARVTGSAGTGKSVVALHRAAWLAQKNPEARVLLTTFSRTLAARLSKNADILLGKSPVRKRIEIEHLHKIARDIWVKKYGRQFQALSAKRVTALMESARDQVDGAGPLSVSFLRSEWEAMVDALGLSSWDEYKNAPRANRGTPLGARQRLMIWKVFETFHRSLQREGLGTWNSLCREAAQALSVPPYAHVIADEAQDFGPAELRLLRALAPTAKNDLLLCGDAGQRIYKARASLLSCGIDIRGRSSSLKINYRTTQQIRQYADALFAVGETDADGDSIARDALSVLNGPVPRFIACSIIEEETAALAEWLQTLTKDGLKANEIAIFARTESVLEHRGATAVEAAGLKSFLLSDESEGDGGVALGTMHRAKGLEYKAVAVIGCDKDILPLKSVLEGMPDPADRSAFSEQERNLLYVALTRPREHLFVSLTGLPSQLLPRSSSP
ncbi:MAG: 3'-5' exonuclease [Bryobacteraceae bacterium]